MAVQFYIVSLKHTHVDDDCITLWRPDNAGYAWWKSMAGLYENPELGYHDDAGNMPVSECDAARLFKTGATGHEYLPNTNKVWAALGVKRTKKGLLRLITDM
jgi:hypothetical protein